MSELNGSNVLVYVYDKDYVPGTEDPFQDKFLPVSDQKDLSDEQSKNIIDASAKGDTHAKGLYGRQESTVSLEALYIPNPEDNQKGYLVLKNCFKQNKVAYFKICDGTNTEYAEALIESMSRAYPDDDVCTVSVELRLNTPFSDTVPTIDDAKTAGSETA